MHTHLYSTEWPHILYLSSSHRFTDAQHHEFLLAFMRSVAACYLSQGRAKDFVLDLLQLDVPSLFVTETEGSTSTLQSGVETVCVPDEFTSFLTDYIQRNRLQEAMLREVESIWVRPATVRVLVYATHTLTTPVDARMHTLTHTHMHARMHMYFLNEFYS